MISPAGRSFLKAPGAPGFPCSRRNRLASGPRLAGLFGALLAFSPAGQAIAAEDPQKRSLALDAKIAASGDHVEFDWPGAKGTKVGRVIIQRRKLGQTGKASWQSHASVRGFARIYRDDTIRPGIAYEYQVSRPSKEVIETGYWAAGTALPAEENRGVALMVVDETIADDLAPQLDRFAQDLVGDGFRVLRHRVARDNKKDAVANLRAARKIRGWIRDRYNAAFYLPHALILVGKVPIIKSGKSKPDGHTARALETDLFYADTNAIWLDDGKGVLLHNTVPGDHIEMQVGRIDFSRLDEAFGDELSLLRRYFDKNHAWRHGRLGDLRQAYGASDHLLVERNALRNIVGPENVVQGNHHDTGTRQAWLLGVDFGSSKYEVYSTGSPVNAIFSINFGSGKLDFSRWKNEMKALLAQPGDVLTTGWGGRPAWQLHHLALGKSIGYSHLRTVNNGTISQGGHASMEYSPSGIYEWANPVWLNLLGDPTLRPFPAYPVGNLRARVEGDGLRLDWDHAQAKAAVTYRIYRANDRFGPYQALNPEQLREANHYVDDNPVAGAWYMVRAHTLKKVYAGSFYRYSQGAFAPGDGSVFEYPRQP